jgi:heme a synthase
MAVSKERPSAGFLRLAYLVIALTLALVLVGGVVRVSDSGLGCGPGGSGTKGWPLCGGRVVPLVDTNMIVEYSHRVLAAAVAILIGTLALLAWRRYREHRPLVRASLAALGLVLLQAALGGLTVEKGLEEELVATHLGVAMLQLGLLILVAFLARAASAPQRAVPSEAAAPGAVRVLAVSAAVAVLATIVAGGYMSANELHGTGKAAHEVHTACGRDFPTCGGSFLPFGRSRDLDIHLTHRAFMYLATALVLALALSVLRTRRGRPGDRLRSASLAALGVLSLQVVLGALNVWLGEHPWLVVAHLAVGTLVWCALVIVVLLVLRAPRTAPARAPRSEVEAVPA